MAIINRLPKGLLGFLDIQAQGKNPQEPSPGLFLMSDVTAHYRAQSLGGEGGASVVTTTDQASIISTGQVDVPVPEGEVWEVFGISATWRPGVTVGAANETIGIAIRVRVPSDLGLGGEIDIGLAEGRVTLPPGTPVGGTTNVIYAPSQRFIANPGVKFLLRVTDVTSTVIGTGSPLVSLAVGKYTWPI